MLIDITWGLYYSTRLPTPLLLLFSPKESKTEHENLENICREALPFRSLQAFAKKYKWAAKATAIPLRNVPRVNTPNSTLDTTQFLT